MKTKKHPVRALLINIILIVIAFGLLALAIRNHRDQIQEVLSHRLDPRYFALAMGIYLTGLLFTFCRWYWLVRVIEPTFRLRDALLLGFIGNVFNLVIPGAVGGDFIKAAYLVRMQIKRTQAIASMVIDRILGLLGLFLLAGVAGLAAWPMSPVGVRRLIVIVWVAVIAGLVGLWAIFAQALTRRYPALLEGHSRRALLLRELKEMSESYRRRLDLVGVLLLLSSACHAMSVLAFYLVSRTMFTSGLPTLGQHFLMVPLTLFTTAVPLPFGALGLSEHVGQQLFQMVNHPQGALGMMGFRVLMYGIGLVSVCVYVANIRQVRALTDAAEHLEEDLLEGDLDDPDASNPEENSPPIKPEAEEPENHQDGR